MATLRQLRTRVASITNIQSVTNAMQLVAAARMRRAQEAIAAARPYAQQLDRVLQRLSGMESLSHPLMTERAIDRTALIVLTSDRGLCGSFNTNACRHAFNDMSPDDGILAVGRKGRSFFRNRNCEILNDYEDVFRDLSFASAITIAEDAVNRFLSGEVDRVMLIYNAFVSVAQQQPVSEQLLPIAPAKAKQQVFICLNHRRKYCWRHWSRVMSTFRYGVPSWNPTPANRPRGCAQWTMRPETRVT